MAVVKLESARRRKVCEGMIAAMWLVFLELAAILCVGRWDIIYSVHAAPHDNGTSHDPQLHAGDLQALMDVRSRLQDMPGSFFFESWDFASGAPCATFMGVACEERGGGSSGSSAGAGPELRVTALNLGTGLAGSPGLRGTLHPSLGRLSALVQLTASPGHIRGPLPHSLAFLPALKFLGISKNRLFGPIPASLAGLPQLRTLDLSFNALSGPIPRQLFSAPSLRELLLSHNALASTMPPAVTSPLLHLDLHHNKIFGRLPSRLPLSLAYLSLSRNKLSGPAASLGPLTELYYVDLSFNKLTGGVPSAVLGRSLHSLLLHHNRLSGAVAPPSLVSIENLDLSFNDLEGPLSPFLSTAGNVFLNNNRLRGEVPQEFVDQLMSGQLLTLYLQHNLLTTIVLPPDTLLPLSSSLCIQFNCMPTPWQSQCPDDGGTSPMSLPLAQCNL